MHKRIKFINYGKNIVGKFPSIKLGRIVYFQSLIECDFLYFLDSDPSVLEFEEQSPTIIYFVNKRKRKYTPDFRIVRSTGILVVECKPEAKANDTDNLLKFEVGRAYCAKLGWTFEVITETMLRADSTLKNLKLLKYYATLPASPEIKGQVLSLLAQTPSPSIRQIHTNLASAISFQEFYAAILHMLYWHEINTPLNQGAVTPDSCVSLPKGGQHGNI